MESQVIKKVSFGILLVFCAVMVFFLLKNFFDNNDKINNEIETPKNDIQIENDIEEDYDYTYDEEETIDYYEGYDEEIYEEYYHIETEPLDEEKRQQIIDLVDQLRRTNRWEMK